MEISILILWYCLCRPCPDVFLFIYYFYQWCRTSHNPVFISAGIFGCKDQLPLCEKVWDKSGTLWWTLLLNTPMNALFFCFFITIYLLIYLFIFSTIIRQHSKGLMSNLESFFKWRRKYLWSYVECSGTRNGILHVIRATPSAGPAFHSLFCFSLFFFCQTSFHLMNNFNPFPWITHLRLVVWPLPYWCCG